MHLFCLEIDFLGHHISAQGIEADTKKVNHILSWPEPKSATDTWGFLGLVCYLAAFLPSLADHTGVLTELTTKEAEKCFPLWTPEYQKAFDAIKSIVTGRDCLTTIDLTKMPDHKIYVTTDASDKHSGAVLSFGQSWETVHPVAFDSMTFKGAELNYPMHKKELLAIIRALKKWQVDLLGSEFFIYTDHKTLENFNTQKDLSCHQARWMEFMSQFDARIVYIKGEDNLVADALSRLPCLHSATDAENSARHPYTFCADDDAGDTITSIWATDSRGPLDMALALAACELPFVAVNTTMKIAADIEFLDVVKAGYTTDSWCKMLSSATPSLPDLVMRDGLWYIGNRLIIP